MANFKRTLAIALAGTISLSSFTGLGFAAELTTEKKLEVLKNLDIIKGDSSDKDSLNLTKNMERYRSVTLSLRLAEGNKEDELNKYDNAGQPSFKDAGSFSSYVEKLMAFTKNNDLGVDGYEDGTFRPLDQITDKAYAKLMLEALGYEYGKDFTWNNAVDKAEELGLAKKGSLDNTNANFGEIVELTYNALATPVKGGSMTLGEKINKPVVESNFEVKSISSDNLKQITVKFSKAVDEKSAKDLDNYKLKGASLTDSKIEVMDDTTVVINLGTPASQQEKVTLTVAGVKDKAGKVMNKTEKEMTFLDQTLPKVANTSAVGYKTIRVEFSEPMKNIDKNDLTIQDGTKKLYIASVKAINDARTKFDVTLYNTLKDGEISVRVAGATDYAGFSVIPQTEKIEVTVDKEAPVVSKVVEASPEKVVLEFDGDIQLNKTELENFYHTNTKNKADSIEVKENRLTINFAKGSELPQGTAYVFINKEAIVDLWGNKSDDIRVKIDVTEDNQAPEIEEVKVVAEDQVTLKFNEAVKESTVTDKRNYTLLDSEGKEKKLISRIELDGKVATVKFSEKLAGDYTLVMKKIEDLSKNEFEGEVKFNVKDLTAPKFSDFIVRLYNVNDEDQVIRINYKEAMTLEGKYSVISEDNYVVKGKSLADIKDAYITEEDNGKVVELHIPKASLNISYQDSLEIARVADAAGNKTTTLSGTINLQGERAVSVWVDPKATDRKTIVVDLNDTLTNIETDDFVITSGPQDQSVIIPVSSVVVNTNRDNKDRTQIVFTLAEELSADGRYNGKKVFVTTKNETQSSNVYGVKLDSNLRKEVSDNISPEAIKDESKLATDGRSATIKFTSQLRGNYDLVATELVINADGEDLVAGVDYTVSHNWSDTLTISFTKAVESNVTIGLKDKVNYLGDGNGNKAAKFSFEFNK